MTYYSALKTVNNSNKAQPVSELACGNTNITLALHQLELILSMHECAPRKKTGTNVASVVPSV